MNKEFHYSSYTEDFVQTACQDYSLPEAYKWIDDTCKGRFLSKLIYAIALIFGSLYCRLWLRMGIHGKKKLRRQAGGFILYGNHTQPLGDVFMPALCAFPKRIYTVVSPSNLGIPVLGRLLPYLGALPTGQSIRQVKQWQEAVEKRLKQGHPVVVYPEAHVWPYCNFIRPYGDTAFKMAVKNQCPAYAMTAVYRQSKPRKRPRMDIYIDGPFLPNGEAPKQMAGSIHEQVYQAMCARSATGTGEYIRYIPQNKET